MFTLWMVHALRTFAVGSSLYLSLAFLTGSPVFAQEADDSKSPSKPGVREKGKGKDRSKAKRKSDSERNQPRRDKAVEVEGTDGPPSSGDKKPESVPTVKVVEEPMVKTVKVEGMIESQVNIPLIVKPEVWTSLQVVEAIPHGSKVKKGDVLIRFDTTRLVLEIEDLEASLPLSELKLDRARSEYEIAERTLPKRIESKRKSRNRLEDDFAYFEGVEHPMDIREAKERLKAYQNRLAYSEEELRQLEKMYESDDITEETEEIVLKRARDAVERDRWDLEQIEVSTDRRLKTTIPRSLDSRIDQFELSRVEREEEVQSMRRELEIKHLEFTNQRRELAKSKERLANLKRDLHSLILKAPRDGIVCYGAVVKGKWITAQTEEKKLIPGGSITSGKVIMTLIDPDQVQVRLFIPEGKLKGLREKQKAKVTMTWNPDLVIDSTLRTLSYVPQTDSKFDGTGSLNLGGIDLPVVPGMKAEVSIDTYRNEKALVIPKTALHREKEKHYVLMKGGKKRWVKAGESNESKQEILEGLKRGEEIENGKPKNDEAKKS